MSCLCHADDGFQQQLRGNRSWLCMTVSISLRQVVDHAHSVLATVLDAVSIRARHYWTTWSCVSVKHYTLAVLQKMQACSRRMACIHDSLTLSMFRLRSM